MANQPRKDQPLGGFKFNQVGAPVSSQKVAPDDTGPIRIAPRFTRQSIKTFGIIIVLIILAAVIYVVSDYGLGGVSHTQGHSLSPADKPTEPTHNF